jgi:hypothetical protein
MKTKNNFHLFFFRFFVSIHYKEKCDLELNNNRNVYSQRRLLKIFFLFSVYNKATGLKRVR